jgi:hypothetical protein
VEPLHTFQGFRVQVPVGDLGQGELLEEEFASLASKYMNLECEPTSTEVSLCHTSITKDAEIEWEVQPQPTPMTSYAPKFGMEADTSGVVTRESCPRRYHPYRSSRPPRHLDEEGYTRKYGLAMIEAKPRLRLAECFLGEGVKSNKRRGEKKDKEVEMAHPIVAFSRVISGRTVYNP